MEAVPQRSLFYGKPIPNRDKPGNIHIKAGNDRDISAGRK